MKNGTSHLAPLNSTELSVHRGEGMSDPWGCTVHMLTRKPARPGKTQHAECTHTKNVFKQFTGACPNHTSECAGERYCTQNLYVHYLKQVVSTALLRTCSCPFIYSTLINVKNQFGPADTVPATAH